MAPPAVARAKLEAAGVDWLIEQIEEGRSFRDIAREVGVNQMSLHGYLRDNPIHSARVDAALIAGAERYEAEAVAILTETYNKLDTGEPHPNGSALASLARERAQAAWRQASVRDPRRYSDRRGGDTYIDARKQALTAITIQTVKAGGGVRAGVGGSDEKVGVLPSDAAKLLPSSDAVVDAAPQKLELPELKVIRSDQWRKIGNIPDLEDL